MLVNLNIVKKKYEELKAEGYSNNDNIGKDGLESVMEKYLRGTDAFRKVALDATGSASGENGDYAAIPGDQVYLTIDAKLQKVAEEALKDAINKIATGGYTDGSAEAQSVVPGGQNIKPRFPYTVRWLSW